MKAKSQDMNEAAERMLKARAHITVSEHLMRDGRRA